VRQASNAELIHKLIPYFLVELVHLKQTYACAPYWCRIAENGKTQEKRRLPSPKNSKKAA
jgi:hypothetical protein